MSVIVSWIIGIKMDLDFNLLETGSLALTIIATAFTLQVYFLHIYIIFNLMLKYIFKNILCIEILQDGTSHYLKGVVLLLCYFVIGASFFVSVSPTGKTSYIFVIFVLLYLLLINYLLFHIF